MPKRNEYAQGTPNWVDLQTTDQAAAKQFYSSVFGWSYDDNPVPGSDDVYYSMATLSGETVAAIAPIPPGAPAGMPPMWHTYIAVDTIDAVVSKVASAGGQVLMGPVDIGEAGRMAFVADPTGPAVGLWQAAKHIGATVVNEPGTLIWNELLTDQPGPALAFYEAVLGLSHATVEMAPGQHYTLLQVDGSDVGGCLEPPIPGVPNHWAVYFAVDDVEATVAKSTAGGGHTLVEPFDIPSVGRCAVLSDPQGAAFSVLKPAQ
ncbi:MAG: VOC family protein [Mycobacteriaceae bacterium]|nr:VOC family protein [Mycobacteriaceae bacterium]